MYVCIWQKQTVLSIHKSIHTYILLCMEMMENPVITTAGLTYERACIEEWFRKGNSTDPMAHVPVMKIDGRSGRVCGSPGSCCRRTSGR